MECKAKHRANITRILRGTKKNCLRKNRIMNMYLG